MKIIKILCCMLIAAVLLGSVTAYAADSYITLDNFTFHINSDGKAVIHAYEGSETDVVIPQKLMGADVVTIDDYAFFDNSDITSVSFEKASQLKVIGINAFFNCTSLKTLTIPSSVEVISFGAFQSCTGLERVKIENGLSTIEQQAFLGCTALEDIEIPDSVTSIENNAFSGDNNLIIYCSENSYAHSYAQDNGVSDEVPVVYYLGDVNLDDKINIRDVTCIQMYNVGLYNELPTYRGQSFADTNRDGKITIRDATMIQLRIAGKINKF